MNLTFKTILIAPLDWGLGHATRCVPVIRNLTKANYIIIIATSGNQKSLLQKEFPALQFIDFFGYNIHYSKNGKSLPIALLKQSFKFFNCIKREKRWLDRIIDKYKIDFVISDNRFGLSTKKVPCIFITHQLQIQAPNKWLEKIIQLINYKYINQFTECWVPDFEGDNNIAGKLSHPAVMPAVPVKYMGALSRFSLQNKQSAFVYHCCFLLSGPEPQRTLLEEKILSQLASENFLKCYLIRGLPNSNYVIQSTENLTIKNHLPEKELEQIILQSEFIIARSGYTTIMEIIALQKKSILIPTPGQTEQEYLAGRLMKQQWCYSVNQNNFVFAEAFSRASIFNYSLPYFTGQNIDIENFLENIFR
jgi:uncharacterized protein (TIGR00661 family)